MVPRALGVAALVGGLAGCISFDEVHCADGHVCPAGTKCDATLGCVSPQQVDACAGIADGQTCNVAGAQGVCTNGACALFYCGDGKRDGIEQCEGDDLGANVDCSTLGFYDPGGLRCTAYCTYDVSQCSGFCGDGITNGPEQCDTTPPIGESCLDFSFDAGRLGCALCAPGLAGCTRFGWEQIASPTTQRLHGIWGAASNDFYVVGAAGTLLHYDGTELLPVVVPTSEDLNGAWGSGSADIFAVGNNGAIVHFDGTMFATQAAPTSAQLVSVWGSGPSDVYAVGVGGAIAHYDGSAWSAATSPTASTLLAVWGSGASDVYAAGAPNGTTPTVLHYNGTTWSALAVPFPSTTVFAIWGSGPTDVSFAGKDSTGAAQVLHYDGSSTWTRVDPLPAVTAPSQYSAIWGNSALDAFAVGDALLHYDGAKWTRLPPPPSPQRLWAVWGSPTGDVWAVGESGYVVRWGGADWTFQQPTPTNNLRGVWSLGTSDALAVGFGGTILRYDGALWKTLTSPTANDLYAVWAASASFAVAVGNAAVIQFDGTSWKAQTCPASITDLLLGVWGTGASDVHAVGFAGAAWHDNGSCWSTTGPTGADLYAATGSSATDVFASGAIAGAPGAARYSTSWTTVSLAPPSAYPLAGIWSAGPSDVHAVGDEIFHFDGTAWTQMTAANQRLHAVSGTGPRNVFAVGDGGKLLHYDGIAWTPIRVPTTAILHGVSATARSLFVVGDGGFAQRLAFSVRPSEVNCRDGWDDDGDGMPDCADSDCASDSYCARGGTCPYVQDLACGDTVTGSTLGRTPARDYYTCDANPETGPEAIYRFVPPASGNATATLSGFAAADLDLVVVGAMAASDACDPDFACLGASSTSNASEAVSFATTAARPYFVIVEGKSGAAGPFTLSVSCP